MDKILNKYYNAKQAIGPDFENYHIQDRQRAREYINGVNDMKKLLQKLLEELEKIDKDF